MKNDEWSLQNPSSLCFVSEAVHSFSVYFIDPYLWHIQLAKIAIFVIIGFPVQYAEAATLCNVDDTVLCRVGISKEISVEEQLKSLCCLGSYGNV